MMKDTISGQLNGLPSRKADNETECRNERIPNVEPFVQLAGHPGTLSKASSKTLYKEISSSPECPELKAYVELHREPFMSQFLAKFHRRVEIDGQFYIEIDDLTSGLSRVCIIDIKLGSRTFLEKEVSATNSRNDLYKKMIKVDPKAPTETEHAAQAVTKLRYMQFREKSSTSQLLSYRIEGIHIHGAPKLETNADLKRINKEEQVIPEFARFFNSNRILIRSATDKLRLLRRCISTSPYFRQHEAVGTSLLIVHDQVSQLGVYLIDFAKNLPTPNGMVVHHQGEWLLGNKEEGLLDGLDNIIRLLLFEI